MKKKITRAMLAVSMIICGFVLGACADTAIAEQNYPLKIWSQNRNGQMETWCVVDDETGVNYIVVAPCYSTSGNKYDGVTITPRLKADGALYTTNNN